MEERVHSHPAVTHDQYGRRHSLAISSLAFERVETQDFIPHNHHHHRCRRRSSKSIERNNRRNHGLVPPSDNTVEEQPEYTPAVETTMMHAAEDAKKQQQQLLQLQQLQHPNATLWQKPDTSASSSWAERRDSIDDHYTHRSSPISSAAPSTNASSTSLYSKADSNYLAAPTPLSAPRPPVSRDTSNYSIESNATVKPSSPFSHSTSSTVQQQSASSQASEGATDYPQYPNQAYDALSSQHYPKPYQPHIFRSHSLRPSHPGHGSFHHSCDLGSHAREVRTASTTPVSGHHGLFTPRISPGATSLDLNEEGRYSSPFLHPAHMQAPKETHFAEIARSSESGNKLINQYEILDELGRGQHGKVKLGRDIISGEKVAIKIVPRYSRRRRLGKITNAENKVKKEVAILKKARHPHVVSLLEVIDDPSREKVYIVLEYVELGEIVWRKQGASEIVFVEKRRFEREVKGTPENEGTAAEDQRYLMLARNRRLQREKQTIKQRTPQIDAIHAWSLEYGGDSDDDDLDDTATENCLDVLRQSSLAADIDQRIRAAHAGVEGTMYGPYADCSRGRSSNTATPSCTSLLTCTDFDLQEDDDFNYVPCLTMTQALHAFRDTVLGLEYLHYQGIIHRDIKPANLLWTADHHVKISDFGVSYLGKPIRDDDDNEKLKEEDVLELDNARELSKTVGTPAFYAPELCFTDQHDLEAEAKDPKITGQIDVWALGVTLYGMIFGRLPFIGDDEYAIYRKIVKDEVFIPRKRLRAVDDHPTSRPGSQPRVPLSPTSNKRLDGELAYDDVDDTLYDLLKRLLEKDPKRRITLKEVKHHPWVVQGIRDPSSWLEETDPSRQSEGRRIEVTNEEIDKAVVKLNVGTRLKSFAKSMGTAVALVLGGSKSRKRAISQANSADGNNTLSASASNSSISTLGKEGEDLHGKGYRESRRGSIPAAEHLFQAIKSVKATREGEHHPLAQSQTASPEQRESPTASTFLVNRDQSRHRPLHGSPRPKADRPSSRAESTRTIIPNDSAAQKLFTQDSPRAARLSVARLQPSAPIAIQSSPATPIVETLSGPGLDTAVEGLWRGSEHFSRLIKAHRSERPPSLDRVAAIRDPHSEPSLALSHANAAGHVDSPDILRDEHMYPSRLRHQHSSQEAFETENEHVYRLRCLEAQRSRSRPTSTSSFYDWHPPDDEHRFQDEPHYQSHSENFAQITPSSSTDYINSGSISQSTSNSCLGMSGASSLTDDTYPSRGSREALVPPTLQTGETVKPFCFEPRCSLEEDAGYTGEDDNVSSESDSDEGLTFGNAKRRKSRAKSKSCHSKQEPGNHDEPKQTAEGSPPRP